jgi:hypothetical protein
LKLIHLEILPIMKLQTRPIRVKSKRVLEKRRLETTQYLKEEY